MKLPNFETLSVDELWEIHVHVGDLLAEKLTAEKGRLEERLKQLRGDVVPTSLEMPRRQYPKVFPKYHNPDDPLQTWSGRGKTPRWVNELLGTGKSIEDLRIPETA
jgi:DNA-binding protein H-NS